jgi:hypothetical protein
MALKKNKIKLYYHENFNCFALRNAKSNVLEIVLDVDWVCKEEYYESLAYVFYNKHKNQFTFVGYL